MTPEWVGQGWILAGYAALADRVEFRFGLFLDARLCCAYELIVRRAPCGVNFPFKMRHLRLIGSNPLCQQTAYYVADFAVCCASR